MKCDCAFCDWVRRNSDHVQEPRPGHAYVHVPGHCNCGENHRDLDGPAALLEN